jgi:hypothetical protein
MSDSPPPATIDHDVHPDRSGETVVLTVAPAKLVGHPLEGHPL